MKWLTGKETPDEAYKVVMSNHVIAVTLLERKRIRDRVEEKRDEYKKVAYADKNEHGEIRRTEEFGAYNAYDHVLDIIDEDGGS